MVWLSRWYVFWPFQPIESLPFSDQERSLIESYHSINDEKIKECILNFAEFAGGK